uniref:Uncharacterized protein n=1 Tax=Candidatus Kentrum sp. LPFa TaxID=2126335 RepID=A0A450Y069_9GAMM|nr:MAG: hypothetical protein BECKLPF1236C_GA0070990_103114 [Candidatus Kentron sp. LPFa]
MRFAYPPYAGTFFICWGDETLNMIVNLFISRSALQMDQILTALYYAGLRFIGLRRSLASLYDEILVPAWPDLGVFDTSDQPRRLDPYSSIHLRAASTVSRGALFFK